MKQASRRAPGNRDVDAAREPSEPARRPGPFATVLAGLARELDAARVPHAFLRGIGSYPDLRPDSDVDLCVRPRDLPAFARALETSCARAGAVIDQRFRAGFLAQFHLVAREETGRYTFLTVDVHTAEAVFGIPFLEVDALLAERRDPHGFRLPDEAFSAVVDFLAPYLSGGVVNGRYARRLAALSGTAGPRARALLRRLFGEREGDAVHRELARGDHGALERRHRRRRRGLVARCFLRAPWRSLCGLVAFGHGVRIRPLWRPRGRFVVFLGTDGAGKTTILEGVARELARAFRAAESGTFHLRPGLLPQLDRVVHLGRRTQGPADWSRPHRAAPSGRLLSNLRAAWYALDYTFGYAIRVLPRRRRHALILFDRYIDDYLVDPKRYRVRPGTLLVRFLVSLVPRPDAVIVVTADAETVRARKQELAPAESARQLAGYEALAARGGRYHLVRNDGSVQAAVDAVVDVLFSREAA